VIAAVDNPAHKALITGSGPRMRKALDLALPTHRRFARQHGYRLIVDYSLDDETGRRDPRARRLPRFQKLPIVMHALRAFDLVLWVDADAMVCAFDRDVAADLPAHCFQGLVLECRSERVNPNSGLWLLRNTEEAHAFLHLVACMGDVGHSWADQAAVCTALGWDLGDHHGHGARPRGHLPTWSGRHGCRRSGTLWALITPSVPASGTSLVWT